MATRSDAGILALMTRPAPSPRLNVLRSARNHRDRIPSGDVAERTEVRHEQRFA